MNARVEQTTENERTNRDIAKCAAFDKKVFEKTRIIPKNDFMIFSIVRTVCNKFEKKSTKNTDKLTISTQFSSKNGTYELCAVLFHEGETTYSGHYICHIRCGDKWWLCNDNVPPVHIGNCTDNNFDPTEYQSNDRYGVSRGSTAVLLYAVSDRVPTFQVRGIKNPGVLCYMNSAMQLLRCIVPYVNVEFSNSNDKKKWNLENIEKSKGRIIWLWGANLENYNTPEGSPLEGGGMADKDGPTGKLAHTITSGCPSRWIVQKWGTNLLK